VFQVEDEFPVTLVKKLVDGSRPVSADAELDSIEQVDNDFSSGKSCLAFHKLSPLVQSPSGNLFD
jgi:hypothetical protein